MKLQFSAELWEWEGQGAAWFFVSVPGDESELIRSVPRPPKPGFGSLRVQATIGSTTWSTSVFPDSKRDCYVLPVKKAVRSAEALEPGAQAHVTLLLVD